MAVELMNKPGYQVPSNMTYIQGNALDYLERASPHIAKSVTDDFFFHHTMWGKGSVKDTLKTIGKFGDALSGLSSMPDLMKNQTWYIKNVKKVLAPLLY